MVLKHKNCLILYMVREAQIKTKLYVKYISVKLGGGELS